MSLEQLLFPALPRVFRAPGAGVPVPALPAADDFTRADGAPGSTPTGNFPWDTTALIASNKLVANPTYGPELLTNPGFESWSSPSDADGWTETPSGSSTANQESSVVHGGSYSMRADIVSGASLQVQFVSASSLNFYRARYWARTTGGSMSVFMGISGPTRTPGATWTQYTETRRGSGGNLIFNRGATSGSYSYYVDDASLMVIPIADCVALIDAGQAEVTVGAVLGGSAIDGYSRGVAARWDASRQNGLLAIQTGGAAQALLLLKCVAGVYTQLISVNTPFVAGATLEIVCAGDQVTMNYNGAMVGTTQTVSDAGILSNTRHGVFVTDPASPIVSFSCTSP